jgi:hypothetical protein
MSKYLIERFRPYAKIGMDSVVSTRTENATACASKAIEYAEGFLIWASNTAVRCGANAWSIGAGKETKLHTTTELRLQYEQYLETIKTK